MKGTIVKCLAELVVSKFGDEKWQEIQTKAGADLSSILMITDVDDASVVHVLQTTCQVLGLTLQQAADAFGDYWVNVYSQKTYQTYYKRAKNAREFMSHMDQVHVDMTGAMKNARPPRFDYEWKDDRTMIMHYKSPRNMIDIAIGLIKGVGKYYREDLEIRKLSETAVSIAFPK